MKKILFCLLIGGGFYAYHFLFKPTQVVNICDWYGVLSFDILQQFEQETGIHVNYDVFDSNDILEAKLMAGNCGYDVVFPSLSPYVIRQLQSNLYQPLDKNKLSHLKNINPVIRAKTQHIDPDCRYVIPFYWGTLGIAFNDDHINSCLNDHDQAAKQTYQILFDPLMLEKLAPCGVSFLNEAIDVIPLIQRYLGDAPTDETFEKLTKAIQHFAKLRPFIRKFSGARFMNDLMTGEVCIAQAWSGEAHQARDELAKINKRMTYMIPAEGTLLWIDCMAIPKGAPHPHNAHQFINFLMRPDIAAKITNKTYIPTAMDDSLVFIDPKIRYDNTIYPPKTLMEKLFLNYYDPSTQGRQFDQQRTRLFVKTRLAEPVDD